MHVCAAARGYMFEIIVDKALMAGGNFKLLHLDSGRTLQLQLPPLPLHVAKRLEEVKGGGASTTAALWVPERRSSWPVADLYVTLPHAVLSTEQLAQLGEREVAQALEHVRTFLVQTTVAASHPIVAHQYKTQSDVLGTTMFVWAVPTDSELKSSQRMVNGDGKVRELGVPLAHQFALLVSLAP